MRIRDIIIKEEVENPGIQVILSICGMYLAMNRNDG